MTLSPSKSACTGRWGFASFIAALMPAALLVGCAPAETGLQRETARHFQERVLGVSEAAAANDPDAALRSLDSLEADLATSASKGDVSKERQRRIVTVIAAVRADLNAAHAAAQAAAAKTADDAAAAVATAEAKATKAKAEADAAAAAQQQIAPGAHSGARRPCTCIKRCCWQRQEQWERG